MSPPFGEKRSGALSMAGGAPVFAYGHAPNRLSESRQALVERQLKLERKRGRELIISLSSRPEEDNYEKR